MYGLQSTSPLSDKEKQIQIIDKKIKKLASLQNLELAKAARFESKAERLQFRSQYVSDAKKLWKKAAKSREKARQYELEIERLEEEKQALLKG